MLPSKTYGTRNLSGESRNAQKMSLYSQISLKEINSTGSPDKKIALGRKGTSSRGGNSAYGSIPRNASSNIKNSNLQTNSIGYSSSKKTKGHMIS